jgi:hypothetical protein
MAVFGVLLFWAWPDFRTGSSGRRGAVLIVGGFYAVTQIA